MAAWRQMERQPEHHHAMRMKSDIGVFPLECKTIATLTPHPGPLPVRGEGNPTDESRIPIKDTGGSGIVSLSPHGERALVSGDGLISAGGMLLSAARVLPANPVMPARTLLLTLLMHLFVPAAWLAAADTPRQSLAAPHTYIVGISPFLDKSVKDDVYRSMIRLVVQDLPLNSTLAIYDAYHLKTITQLSLPNSHVFEAAKTRANQFAPAIGELKQFLAREQVPPSNGQLHFENAIRLPQFLDFLSENVRVTNTEANLLLIGSPLYQDAQEPAFSMLDGYFPSDGHLQASREQSIFGFSGDADSESDADLRLQQSKASARSKDSAPGSDSGSDSRIPRSALRTPHLTIQWMYFGDPWINDLHKEKVARFWTLYLQRRNAGLASLTADFPTVLQHFTTTSGGTIAAGKQWAVDKDQRKIEMLRVSRKVEATDWLTQGSLSDTAQTPPATLVGPMKIGIRWQKNIDLDLYASPRPNAETLFFQHVRSPEGYYFKDHRSSPGKEYEFIEFESPVDVREVLAFVNFYKGSCPGGPQGEVRIEFGGKIYGARFAVAAEEGNMGRNGRAQGEYWTKIPVTEILKLDGAQRADRERR
jgi:hypothetical protein